MASYNKRSFSGYPCLIVEGVCLDPSIQGRGVFKEITNQAISDEKRICLRTQNPRMFRALKKYCPKTYPSDEESPVDIKAATMDFAKYLGCNIDGNGVVKRYYGGLFYGQEPHHPQIDPLFKRLGVDLCKGDGLLVIGVVDPPPGERICLGDGVIFQDGSYFDYFTGYSGLR